jgi:hypothetical protein
MGFKSIAFVGQDLAYTGGISHASGYLEREERSEDELAKDSRFRQVPGYYGDIVYTNAQMDYYRDWFESEIKKDVSFNVYNCTEGGAKIRGAIQIPLKQLATELDLIEKIPPTIPAFPQKIDTNKLLKYLRNDLKTIFEAKELALAGLNSCLAVFNNSTQLPILTKAKNSIVRTRKFLVSMNSKNANPYLAVMWNHSLHEIAKVETAEDATPEEVVKPFIPFFYNLNGACKASEDMLVNAITAIKKGDPKVASNRQLDAVI